MVRNAKRAKNGPILFENENIRRESFGKIQISHGSQILKISAFTNITLFLHFCIQLAFLMKRGEILDFAGRILFGGLLGCQNQMFLAYSCMQLHFRASFHIEKETIGEVLKIKAIVENVIKACSWDLTMLEE